MMTEGNGTERMERPKKTCLDGVQGGALVRKKLRRKNNGQPSKLLLNVGVRACVFVCVC